MVVNPPCRIMFRLPPLRSIQVFDACARHRCFSLAAQELAITQGAVSKQIKLLESFYAEPLFLRQGAQVALTAKGHWLASEVLPIFDKLYALGQFGTSKDKIRIASYPSFSTRYLLYQVDQFNRLYPDIDVEIVLSVSHPELCDEVADLFITVEPGSDGYHSQLLFEEQLIAVASAKILPQQRPLTVAELNRYTLLVASDYMGSDWQRWFAHNGVTPSKYQQTRTFNHVLLTTEAAERNYGIALSCHMSVSQDLLDGRLIDVGLPSCPSGLSYYLCCKSRRRYEPSIKLFADWFSRVVANQLRRHPHNATTPQQRGVELTNL